MLPGFALYASRIIVFESFLVNCERLLEEEMELVQHNSQKIPGSVQYVISRYRKMPQVVFDESAMLVYNYREEEKERHLELIFLQGRKPVL